MQIVWHPSDDELHAFIQTYLDSFCTWDLLVFLSHNPDTVDTARGLAARIGRPPDEIEKSLERLCGHGMMESAVAFGESIYRLLPDESGLAVLRRFAAHQADPAVRTEALRRIMDQQRQD